MPPRTPAKTTGLTQDSPSSVYSRPTDSAGPTPTASVRSAGRGQARVEAVHQDTNHASEHQQAEPGEASVETESVAVGRRRAMTGPEARGAIIEGLIKSRETEEAKQAKGGRK